MTPQNKPCRFSLLSASVSVVLAALSMPAAAIEAGAAPAARPAGGILTTGLSLASSGDETGLLTSQAQELYLEVVLNQSATGRLARFVMEEGQLRASVGTLRELGIKWPGSASAAGLVALRDIPGLQADYDAARQRISLSLPLAMLDRAPVRFGFSQPDAPRIDPATRAPGLILNYDWYGQRGDGYGSLSGWNELRLFGVGPGTWSNTMNSRLVYGQGLDGESIYRHENVRLDTSWQLDLPDRMLSVSVGDAVSGAVSWSRATRFGGVRVSRNFSLQPYRVTAPLASFTGEAALPSTVDLLINGLRQSSQQVQPGQFQIDSVPALNGAGHAQLVITDLNGRSQLVNFSLYGSPELLQAGLSDWSVDMGVVRQEYGNQSFAYADDPMAIASGRYGLSDRTTLEAHAETTRGLQLGGIGGVWLLGSRGGVFSGAIAGSSHAGNSGLQGSASYQWSSPAFNLFLGSTRRDAEFRDVASLENSVLPRGTDQAFLGFNSWLGQWGTSYVSQQYASEERTRFLSLSWSRQLPVGGNLNFSVNRDLGRRDGYSAYLSWSMPLDRYTSVSASGRHSRNARNVSAEVSRAAPADLGGWGWRAQSTLGDNAGAQAQISQLGRYGQWLAGADHWRGSKGLDSSTSIYANANGGLVLMGGHAYAMRRVDDSFALVSTHGVANVPVKLENRLVGHTDDNGLLFINRLNAWQRNQLSIDPMQLPADMLVERTTLDAVPQSRSGMLADFAMRRIVSVQASLRDDAGEPVAAGSEVFLLAADGGAPVPLTFVGHDGAIYLQDPPGNARLQVKSRSRSCSATLPAVPGSSSRVDLGELTCR
ncbi:MAG: fimbrial biogenesis outer membrane usher protein [Lysobacteraceae bacterium]|nr:MAG: fimbrial biogenesis outer membrane usher protein [Xanthomonadaceae bacterium]